MADNATFIDGFLEDIRGQEKAAIQGFIGSQNSSQEQIQAAFTALEQSQKPTLVDKGGDIALALAAIVDISKGGRKGRLSSEKFRELRAGRKEDRAGRSKEARNKLGTRLKLAEFSGDISGRNLTALLNTFGQERGDLITSIKTEFEGRRVKALEDRTKAEVKKAGKGVREPSAKEKLTAALTEIDKEVMKTVNSQTGSFIGNEELWEDKLATSGLANSGVTPEEFYIITRDRLIAAEKNRLYTARGLRPEEPTGGLAELPRGGTVNRTLADLPPEQGFIPQQQGQPPVDESGGFFNTLGSAFGSESTLQDLYRKLTGGK